MFQLTLSQLCAQASIAKHAARQKCSLRGVNHMLKGISWVPWISLLAGRVVRQHNSPLPWIRACHLRLDYHEHGLHQPCYIDAAC